MPEVLTFEPKDLLLTLQQFPEDLFVLEKRAFQALSSSGGVLTPADRAGAVELPGEGRRGGRRGDEALGHARRADELGGPREACARPQLKI